MEQVVVLRFRILAVQRKVSGLAREVSLGRWVNTKRSSSGRTDP